MKKYSVEIVPSVHKSIASIDKKTRDRIIGVIEDLENNPRPYGCLKLQGYEGYRIRVGDYRIIYEIEDNILIVTVVRVGHRKYVYE